MKIRNMYIQITVIKIYATIINISINDLLIYLIVIVNNK